MSEKQKETTASAAWLSPDQWKRMFGSYVRPMDAAEVERLKESMKSLVEEGER